MMLDRQTWRLRAQHAIELAFKALESGRLPFGKWERLFLSAAIDQFRDRDFEQSVDSVMRIYSAAQTSQPFPGRFGKEKSLADHRVEFEALMRLRR
jgi:hypothetical protein